MVPADPASLHLDFEPLAEGELEVETLDAGRVTVEPVFARLRRRLDRDYTPEQASEICEAHPDVIRMLARKVASKRTRLSMGMGVAKYYHGDLISRSALLLLALTGNWGKKGAGTGSWNSFTFDGMSTVMAKTKPGVEGGMEVVNLARTMREQMLQQDPTLTGELADRVLWRMMGGSVMVPPVFFWYHQAGFRERWNRREWGDPAMKRSFDEYFHEASQQETWKAAAETAATKPARVLLEIGGNTLRRTRGGKKAVFENLWPKLTKVVCMDYRMSETALHADIVLPAAQHYEKAGFPIAGPYTMTLAVSQAATPPYAEARSEWEMLGALCKKIARESERAWTGELHAQRRASASLRRALEHIHAGAERWSTGRAMSRRRWPTRWHRGTCRPAPRSTPSARRGTARYNDWSFNPMGQANASPFPRNETHAPLRNHVELGHPYPTLTRRAQFLIDHPWFREAGEDLPLHKEAPAMGGDHPFRLSGGHARWSNHAMNMTNDVMLETHRGKPFVLINDRVAREKGIEDDALVRIWNDLDEFVVPARTSPAQRPDGLTVYNGFEGFMFPGGKSSKEIEPGMVKWLHLAAGDGHLQYSPLEWQPVPFDRCIFVDCESYRDAIRRSP